MADEINVTEVYAETFGAVTPDATVTSVFKEAFGLLTPDAFVTSTYLEVWGIREIIVPSTPIYITDTEDSTDDGVLFQAYVKTRAMPPAGTITQLGEVGNPVMLVAKPLTGANLRLTIDRDLGQQETTSDISLTPDATERRVFRKFEAAAAADITAFQFQLGDAAAVASGSWSLDRLEVVAPDEGDR